jgi:hypothetical protein
VAIATDIGILHRLMATLASADAQGDRTATLSLVPEGLISTVHQAAADEGWIAVAEPGGLYRTMDLRRAE